MRSGRVCITADPVARQSVRFPSGSEWRSRKSATTKAKSAKAGDAKLRG
jgi:hypothetical protein